MKKIAFLVSVFVTLAISPFAFASGGGGGGGSFGGGGFSGGGGSKARTIDQEKYSLGSRVFKGQGVASQVISKRHYDQQVNSLKKLIRFITKKHSKQEAQRLRVRELVGRMNQKQVNALKYYVRVKYGNKSRYR